MLGLRYYDLLYIYWNLSYRSMGLEPKQLEQLRPEDPLTNIGSGRFNVYL